MVSRDVSQKRRCISKTRAGNPCKGWAITGRDRCSIHSKVVKAGIMAPNFKGRDRSKYLPPRMSDSVQEALSDSDLTSLRQDLVTVDARVDDLIKRDGSGESGEAWRELGRINEEINRLERVGGQNVKDEITYLRGRMSDIIEEGLEQYSVWQEIESLIDLRRKLSESERRRMVLLSQFTPNERVLTLMQVVLGVIREETRKDPETLRRISARVGKYINLPAEVVKPQHGPRN